MLKRKKTYMIRPGLNLDSVQKLLSQLVAAQILNAYHYRVKRLKKKNATEANKAKIFDEIFSEWQSLSQQVQKKLDEKNQSVDSDSQ